MVGESNQNLFLIQIDASSFAEFEISDFEISRVDCRCNESSGSNKCKGRLKSAVSVWLRLFIDSNERCNTINAF